MWAEAIGLASSALGAFGKSKGKSETTMPQIMPRAEPFYQAMEEDFFPRVYDKPYQTPFLSRYEPTNKYEQSPILARIQAAIDAQQQPVEETAAPTGPDAGAMQKMIDASLGRQQARRRPGTFMPTSRFDIAMPWLTQGGTDDDYAMAYRLQQNPGSIHGGPSKDMIAGLDRGGMKGGVTGSYYDLIKAATGGG